MRWHRDGAPAFAAKLATTVKRLPNAVLLTVLMLLYPALCLLLWPLMANSLPMEALVFAVVPVLWPAAFFVIALPAFWCDGLGPFAAIAQSVRLSVRRSWRMVGAILTTGVMLMAFNLLPMIFAAMITPLFGRVDLFMVATVASIFYLVVGAFGVPFVLAVLIVAYHDLKIREPVRREVRA